MGRTSSSSRNKKQKSVKHEDDIVVEKKEEEEEEEQTEEEEDRVKQEEEEEERQEVQEVTVQPSNALLRSHIRRLIPLVNLQNTGVKAFTKLLSKECGRRGSAGDDDGAVAVVDLSSRSKFIKEALTEAINDMDDDDSDDSNSDDDSDSSSNSNHNKKKKQKTTNKSQSKKAKTKKKKKKKSPPLQSSSSSSEEKKKRVTGLSVKKEITSELSSFLGKDPKELVARTDIVKCLWVYIKEHELQNPNNKREIYLDSKMQELFGVERFTMFTMNKYIGAHVHPYKPVDLTTPSEATLKKKKQKKTAAAAADDDENGTGKKQKRKRAVGVQPPYRLSTALSQVVGTDILPRPQVVKGLWVYIKQHNLQDPNNKRNILCDPKLQAVMGGNTEVTMFKMNTFVTEHLLEKLDKSAYTHNHDHNLDHDHDDE